MIRVLVADDHPVVRSGLRQVLSEAKDLSVEGEASSGSEVLALVASKPFDVVLLDIKLGDSSGLEVLGQLHRDRPRLPVIILTVYPEEHYALRAMRAGAAGFLTKETAPERLIEAVRKCASGGKYLTPGVADELATAVVSDHPEAPHRLLSNRELEILELIGSGKTVGEIAKVLHRSVKTISTHRSRLLGKMQMKNNAELMRYALKNGLVR